VASAPTSRPTTVGLVLASSFAGVLLLRHQGFGVMARIRAEMDAARDPSQQLAHGAMIVVAAILLIIPLPFQPSAGCLQLGFVGRTERACGLQR
ncbi:hypothetical protein EN829_072750, partial [Mesorhizobium sp. M00.F.Ca.ET.186.01.1.1]